MRLGIWTLSTLHCSMLGAVYLNVTPYLNFFFVPKDEKTKVAMGKDLLDLSASIIERLAMVRLDEPYKRTAKGKTFVFWILRELGHPGLWAVAWQVRHSVLLPTLGNVARLGDAEWCRVMVEGGAAVDAKDSEGNTAQPKGRGGRARA